ncbi:MAG TPA: iron-containing alcohol dehydrogenase, partial [Flavisolibacter sp.]|nr:iron-containing alcohol dehydrogenase [Flavisolibacter sp.]
EAGIHYVIYHNIKSNPTVKNVSDGLDFFYGLCCDGLLSIGGGSPQDTAKAIGILHTNGGEMQHYEGIAKSKFKSAPIVAVNTTAGPASEVTVNYIITDEIRKIKMVMVDPNCLATVAVNDPELMINKPADLTASTGFDALTHAIEAYTSKSSYRMFDLLSLEAVKMIAESLEAAVADGSDIEARTGMAWASYIAGLSFSNAGSGITHAMAHQLEAEYDLPHGVASAILLPYVVAYNASACPTRFRNIAVALGKNVEDCNEHEAAQEAVHALHELSEALHIPQLSDTAFDPYDVDKLSRHALEDICTTCNPREISVDDIKDIYLRAYNGVLGDDKQVLEEVLKPELA